MRRVKKNPTPDLGNAMLVNHRIIFNSICNKFSTFDSRVIGAISANRVPETDFNSQQLILWLGPQSN